MKDRATKIILSILSILIAIGAVCFATGKIGNPVSDLLGRRTVKRMISGIYADKKLTIIDSGYVTEEGCYVISVCSEKFPDEMFDIYTDAYGNYLSDTRKSRVLSGWNTAMRLYEQYDSEAHLVFDHIGYEVTSSFATLAVDELGGKAPCIEMSSLKPNEDYDISELGSKYGHITIGISDDSVDAKRMAEVLLGLKNLFDIAEIRFADITLSLRFSVGVGDTELSSETEITEFPYEEIYEDNLTERIQAIIEEKKKE